MIQLRPHQIPHVAKLLSAIRTRGIAHDGSDAGTGKTVCAIDVVRELKCEALVICPLAVVIPWQQMLDAMGVAATVTTYGKAWRHYGEVKKWGKGTYFQFAKGWPLVIFDESHRTAGETTMQSKLLIAAKRQCGKILSLSATAADSVLKLKSLGYALGLHQLSNYREWLMTMGVVAIEFELKNGRKVKKLVISKENSKKAMARLHDQIYGERGSRMRKDEIPNFPKTQIEVRLLPDAPKEILRLDAELKKFHDNRTRLGDLSEDDHEKAVFYRQAAETAKIPILIDMAEDALEHSRCCIFVNFNRTVDELVAACQKRKWTCAVVRGDQTPIERAHAVSEFQMNRLDVIICNIAAGGIGISLHDAVTQVPRTSLISPSWSAVDLIQVLGRPQRDGGGFSQQFLIYFASTIEERVAKSVERKLDNLSLLNDAELSGVMDDTTQALLPV